MREAPPLRLCSLSEPCLHLGPVGVYDLAWTAEGALLLGACQDGALRRWRAAGGPAGPALRISREALLCVDPIVGRSAPGPGEGQGAGVVVGGADGSVHRVVGEEVHRLLQLRSPAALVRASPSGDRVAVAGMDGFLRVLDLDNGALLWMERVAGPVTSLCWSAGGAVLAATSLLHHTAFWSMPEGRRLSTARRGLLGAQATAMQHLQPERGARGVVGVSTDGLLSAADADSGRAAARPGPAEISALSATSEGELLALVSGAIWREGRGGWRRLRPAERSPARWPLRIAARPDGGALAVSLPGGRVELWSLRGAEAQAAAA